jgi:hypothetical protein
MAVASEQGRVYRACINGQISTSDAARLAYQLKEIRCTREAINAEIALAKANEPPPPPGDTHISIVAIPAGHFVTAEQLRQIETGEFVRQGEHETLSLSDYSSKDVQQAERAATRELDTEIEKAARTIPEHREEPAGFETNGRRVVRSQALQRELSPMMQRAMEMGWTPLPPREGK